MSNKQTNLNLLLESFELSFLLKNRYLQTEYGLKKYFLRIDKQSENIKIDLNLNNKDFKVDFLKSIIPTLAKYIKADYVNFINKYSGVIEGDEITYCDYVYSKEISNDYFFDLPTSEEFLNVFENNNEAEAKDEANNKADRLMTEILPGIKEVEFKDLFNIYLEADYNETNENEDVNNLNINSKDFIFYPPIKPLIDYDIENDDDANINYLNVNIYTDTFILFELQFKLLNKVKFKEIKKFVKNIERSFKHFYYDGDFFKEIYLYKLKY